MPPATATAILTLSCADQPGIVHAVAGFLAAHGCNIQDSTQHSDPATERFFMRIAFHDPEAAAALPTRRHGFAHIATKFGMDWQLYDAAIRPRVLLMVSKFDHCLNDLLYRIDSGTLPIDIPTIVSNHPDAGRLAARYTIPFLHLPVTPDTKPTQEAALLDIVTAEKIELVVLARYMQVLSAELCQKLAGRAMNIHHSFLPSFKGARPYHQAHTRGVKLIGATAHYITENLDEGPIIEQDVARVNHADTPDDLIAIGRDVECQVLSRAVRLHIERRVLRNGQRTVVFR